MKNRNILRRVCAGAVILCTALSLAACGESAAETAATPEPTSAPTAAPTPTPAPNAAPNAAISVPPTTSIGSCSASANIWAHTVLRAPPPVMRARSIFAPASRSRLTWSRWP